MISELPSTATEREINQLDAAKLLAAIVQLDYDADGLERQHDILRRKAREETR